MTTTVYFDLDGTLLDYDASFAELFARTVPVEATDEMTEAYSERLLTALDECEDDPYERAFAEVCEAYDLDARPSALADEFVRREVEATYVPESVKRLVATVAEQQQVGILTNGEGYVQRRKIDAHGLDARIEETIVSNEIGVRKPDPEIFETAKRRLPADAFVYVGDTFEEDVTPASECGFETVYVGDDHPEATVSAATTADLAALLLPILADESDW